jgi:hypothetical protein
VTAAATVGVAWIAIVQMVNERARRKEAREAANADVSGRAFMLRRDLLNWLGTDPSKRGATLDDWLRAGPGPVRLTGVFDAAETASRELLAASLNASKAVSREVRLAHIRFVAGVDRLRKFTGEPRPAPADTWDWIQLRKSAIADLAECVALLETHAIDRELLRNAAALEKQRASEDPLTRLSEAIVAHVEQGDPASEPPADSADRMPPR